MTQTYFLMGTVVATTKVVNFKQITTLLVGFYNAV